MHLISCCCFTFSLMSNFYTNTPPPPPHWEKVLQNACEGMRSGMVINFPNNSQLISCCFCLMLTRAHTLCDAHMILWAIKWMPRYWALMALHKANPCLSHRKTICVLMVVWVRARTLSRCNYCHREKAENSCDSCFQATSMSLDYTRLSVNDCVFAPGW